MTAFTAAAAGWCLFLFACLPLISGAAPASNLVQFQLSNPSSTTLSTLETTILIGTTGAATEEEQVEPAGGATDNNNGNTAEAEQPGSDSANPDAVDSTPQAPSKPQCTIKCRKPTLQEIQQSQQQGRREPQGGALEQNFQQRPQQSVSLENSQGGQLEVQQQQQGGQGGPAEEVQATLQIPADPLGGDFDGEADPLGGYGGFYGGFYGGGPFGGGPFGGGPFGGGPGFPFRGGPGFRRRRWGGGPFFRRWKRATMSDNKKRLFRKKSTGNKFWICEQSC